MPKKTMDHAAYQKSLRTKPEESLRFIIKDANEAIKAQPDGENAGYYADEVSYCCMELARRQREEQHEFAQAFNRLARTR